MPSNIYKLISLVEGDTVGGTWLAVQSFKLNVIYARAQRIRSQVHFDNLPFNFISLHSNEEILWWVNYEAPLLNPVSVLATYVGHLLSDLSILRVNYLAGAFIKNNDPKGVQPNHHFLIDDLNMTNRLISTGLKLDNPFVETSIGHVDCKSIRKALGWGH